MEGVKLVILECNVYAKSKGGLGFRSLYGFNLALLGKLAWKFIMEPDSLVARVFKAHYYPNSQFLKATGGSGSSFIWTGILTARNSLSDGYRWVLGNGTEIEIANDPWLRGKNDFKVDQCADQSIGHSIVSDFINANSKTWDVSKVRGVVNEEDACLILSTRIPQNEVVDMVAWTKTPNGHYSVKSGYYMWHDQNMGSPGVLQSNGWGKIWKLSLPHKVKVFLWRFCRNNVPVRNRLRSKGVNIPILCPMCEKDVEHLLHVLFDCTFAKHCWHYAGGNFDMRAVEYAPDWLVQKLSSATGDEILMIVKVLWGIWFFRNKNVWDNKTVTPTLAMDWSTKFFMDWKSAKLDRMKVRAVSVVPVVFHHPKWSPPDVGCLKLNVDASVHIGSDNFSVGMVLRDHTSEFMGGNVMCLSEVGMVLEADVIAISEGFQWLLLMPHQRVVIESDSLLSVQAIHRGSDYEDEVGYVIEHCRELLQSREGFSICFTKRQANKVAHNVTRIPLVANCYVFKSPSFFGDSRV